MIFFADLDECADNNRTCSSGHDCINTLGSYRCRFPCPDGFVRTLNETCVGNSCIFLFKQRNNYRGYTDNLAYGTYGIVTQKFDNVIHNVIRIRGALMVVFLLCIFFRCRWMSGRDVRRVRPSRRPLSAELPKFPRIFSMFLQRWLSAAKQQVSRYEKGQVFVIQKERKPA